MKPSFDAAAFGVLVAVALAAIGVAFAVTLVVARAVGKHAVVDTTWGAGFAVIAVAAYVVTGAAGVGMPSSMMPGIWSIQMAFSRNWSQVS